MSGIEFEALLARAAAGRETMVPASWTQGRTVFGGLSAALLADRLAEPIEDGRRLRYLEIGFVRPLAPEEPFRIDTDDVSSGRTVAVRDGRIVQRDEIRVTARANFVQPPDGGVDIRTFEPPSLPGWDDESVVRIRGPGAPTFTRHFDLRTATAGRPFSGMGVPELGGWMRFDEPPASFGPAHLVCLIDAWPPVPISYYDRPVTLSSISWQLHFAEPVGGIAGTDILGYRAHANFFRGGYGSSSAEVWAPDGRLLAKSFQTFVVFE